jgi:hypothetical protein
MRAMESNHQGPLTDANDQVVFGLDGGLYQATAVASWSAGSATLEQLGPDGTTWLSVATALSANGGVTLYLPPGKYRWTIATATAVYVMVTRIPHAE